MVRFLSGLDVGTKKPLGRERQIMRLWWVGLTPLNAVRGMVVATLRLSRIQPPSNFLN